MSVSHYPSPQLFESMVILRIHIIIHSVVISPGCTQGFCFCILFQRLIPPGARKSRPRLKRTSIITVKSAVVAFTRHVFQVVHVVRPDVFGAGQHVRFAQQRPEVTDVGVGHAAVLAPDVAHVVYDLCVRCRCHRRRPLPSALKGPMQNHPSGMGHGFRRVHNEDDLCRCDNRRYR